MNKQIKVIEKKPISETNFKNMVIQGFKNGNWSDITDCITWYENRFDPMPDHLFKQTVLENAEGKELPCGFKIEDFQ